MNCIALALLLAGAPAAPASSSTTYTLEPNYTQVVLSWDHLGYSFPTAQLAQGKGSLRFDPHSPETASVEVTMPLTSLSTGVPDLDQHLKSEDFFDAANFPVATFVSTSVAKGPAAERLAVTGNLTIRDVTRPLTLQVTLLKVGSNARTGIATAGFKATARLKRSDFGLGAYVPQVGDEVTLQITTQGAEAKAYAAYLEARAAEKK